MSLVLEIHTKDEQVRELCIDYWRLTDNKTFTCKLSELSKRHNLSAAAIRKLVNSNCTAFSEKFSCINCGASRPFKSRTDYTENSRYYSWDSWVCDTCFTVQKEENARLQEQQEGASEDLSYIAPHKYYETPLSPCQDFDLEILMQLYRAGTLCIHPDSGREAIELVEEDPSSFHFYPLCVHWLLPLSEEENAAHIVEELERVLPSKEWPAAWSSEVNALRTRMALEESLQYLRFVLSEHRFDFTVGEKTIQVVKSLLNEFSVAQIYNFSWRAAKDAAAFYMRKHVSKQHAANTVPGSIQRLSERALAEGWEMKPYGRNFNVPQCMVSQVLYNTTLRIGDAGFDCPVPKE